MCVQANVSNFQQITSFSDSLLFLKALARCSRCAASVTGILSALQADGLMDISLDFQVKAA
jgi:hypothetical protein